MEEPRIDAIVSFGFAMATITPRSDPREGLYLPVNIGGKVHWLKGRLLKDVPIDMPFVELLDVQSWHDQMIVSREAHQQFLEATHRLIETGRKFATPLRRNWGRPQIVWELWNGN